jgi:MFS family permease
VLLAGLALVAAGLALLTRAPVGGNYLVHLLPALELLGIGAGLALPAVTTLAMSGVAAEDSGLASGLVNTTQQVGGVLGISVLATLATTRTGRLLADGQTSASALTGGYHIGFGVGAALVAVAAVVTITVMRAPGRKAALSG